jgi:hypothetical protein
VRFTRVDGTFDYVNTQTLDSPGILIGKHFTEMRISSGSSPFRLYVTIGEATAEGTPVGTAPAHPAAIVQFAQPGQTKLEGQQTTVDVKLYTDTNDPFAPLPNPVTVNIDAPVGDVTYSPTQVTFPAGITQLGIETFNVNVLSDSVDEGNENVIFTLANPTGGAQIGSPNTHVLTITNQWEHLFDFTQDFGGFSPCPLPEAPVFRGEHVVGTGWRTTPFNDNQMDSFVIGRNLPNTVSTPLTSITLETTNGVYFAAFYNRNAWIPMGERNAQNTAEAYYVETSKTITNVQMLLTNAFAIDFYSPDGSQRTLTRLTLRGTGSNPFV